MLYTIRSLCEEAPEIPYEDGARTIFLYTKGTEGNPSKELRELLRYIEDTRRENAGSRELQEIQRMVETVKQHGKVAVAYMKIKEREEYLIEKGIQQGIQQGIRQGRENTERERANAEQERLRAETEKARAEKAEQELAQLRESLALQTHSAEQN